MTEARDFWSRRKARVAEEAEAEDAVLEARALQVEQAEKSDAEILADLNLPDPDDLQPGDDFSGFMAKAVPDRLRRRALRKLWLTNPVLANVDGLVDYGEDFTDAACVIENLQTAYQVGKGMTAHVEEMARQAELEAAEDETADELPENEGAEDEQLLSEKTPDEAPEVELAEVELADAVLFADDDAAPTPRRRMQFSFEPKEVTSA
ncbi:DUF3306 domain-containing protein [Roseovarius aestuarii]|uniref:DUF3306 domain-containing protein n=1 Tax=Roseovarius aestuarii TaxID=475083 RepID=A0A1X7BTH0_9RHOB|nr:DUF3306 domain-containing protein [Roseovarius aestuarii]SMC12961.1 hypothetical protein ROA7745_02794 [Roseovarius aestuarii]